MTACCICGELFSIYDSVVWTNNRPPRLSHASCEINAGKPIHAPKGNCPFCNSPSVDFQKVLGGGEFFLCLGCGVRVQWPDGVKALPIWNGALKKEKDRESKLSAAIWSMLADDSHVEKCIDPDCPFVVAAKLVSYPIGEAW